MPYGKRKTFYSVDDAMLTFDYYLRKVENMRRQIPPQERSHHISLSEHYVVLDNAIRWLRAAGVVDREI